MSKITKRYSVKSESSTGKKHSVAKWSNGKWSCDCKGWTRLKGGFFEKPNCKHIKLVKSKLGLRPTGDISESYRIQNTGRKSTVLRSRVKHKRVLKTIRRASNEIETIEANDGDKSEEESVDEDKTRVAIKDVKSLGYKITQPSTSLEDHKKLEQSIVVTRSPFRLQETANLQDRVQSTSSAQILVKRPQRKMANHLTARMAWHDNNWNGTICSDPEANVYCIGTHSLLSERLARERKLEIETEKDVRGQRLDRIPNYLAPCYYTTNAFSQLPLKVEHRHPFRGAKSDIIHQTLPGYSVFTWPFRLSFNHSKSKRKVEGDYPPDLESRINRFRSKFVGGSSFVFFYLNYDNPISADDETAQGYYVLVGCAVIEEVGEAKNFTLDKDWDEYIKKRNYPRYKNFPRMNWAFPVTYDFENTGIRLPYKEYLERIKTNPEEQPKLERMRVLIEEDALQPYFKYVANEMSDDTCIYLLYKIRKAAKIVQEDGIAGDYTAEVKRVEDLIEKAWENRTQYPSLAKILDVIYDPEASNFSDSDSKKIVGEVSGHLNDDEDLVERVFEIIQSSDSLPSYLKPYESWIAAFKRTLQDYTDEIGLLKKLSLFSLKHNQINRILHHREVAFSRKVTSQEIEDNPYLLCEEYLPEEYTSGEDKDKEELPDEEIGLFTIDIGMNPDPTKVHKPSPLQNLSSGSPERIRALLVQYLRLRGIQGDCFVNLDDAYDYIADYPVFYKTSFNFPRTKLAVLEGKFKDHFEQRIFVDTSQETGPYFYLKEVKRAEVIIAKTVDELLEKDDHASIVVPGIKDYNESEADILGRIVPDFSRTQFIEERTKLLSSVFNKHFYIISGKPGSGKTKALGKIVRELVNHHEKVTLLAPTGKAALRLKEEVRGLSGLDPQTIDRFVYGTDFRKCLEWFENILLLKNELKPFIQNLIVDESSMVDLERLATLFEMAWKNSEHESLSVARIILVGDENQLPPIGLGRPFYDIIQRVKQDSKHRETNYIQLRTNCRSNFDPNIMKIAEIYESKNRYYEEKLQKLIAGGSVSKGLTVKLWDNAMDLETHITENLDDLIPPSGKPLPPSPSIRKQGLNSLLGLYETGFVPWDKTKGRWSTDFFERFQILSPYRGESFGTLGLNEHVKRLYNPSLKLGYGLGKRFDHSDKIIRLNNWYRGYGPRRTLFLSNGSIGVVCDNKENKFVKGKLVKSTKRKYYFDESGRIDKIDDEDNFEHAYAITVHKAQGSEFDHVYFVLPRKRSLLSKELVYTALTRSKQRLFLLLQRSNGKSPLEEAREISAILSRNTSIFDVPEDVKKKLWPDKKVPVKSKIEYILYKHLEEAQRAGMLSFKYEDDLYLKNKGLTIHPDFTIRVGGQTYYWEHLGELDLQQYSLDWKARRDDYIGNSLNDRLITTDDLGGVEAEIIKRVIGNICSGSLEGTRNEFSDHHYKLYLE